MEDDFVLQTQDGLWWGTFPRFAAAGFLTACSCRLHGTSALVPGTLNLALHVGDEPDRVLADRRTRNASRRAPRSTAPMWKS